MEPTELLIRQARPEDHRDCVNIRHDINNRIDYLDARYPCYVSKENTHCFVAEIDGVLVSKILSFSLSVSLSLSLPSLCLYVSLCLSLSIYPSLPVSPSVSLYVSLFLSVSCSLYISISLLVIVVGGFFI